MPRKPKFKPEIRRIKLNPEQAVLACGCYWQGHKHTGTASMGPNSGAHACGTSGRAAGHTQCVPHACTQSSGTFYHNPSSVASGASS